MYAQEFNFDFRVFNELHSLRTPNLNHGISPFFLILRKPLSNEILNSNIPPNVLMCFLLSKLVDFKLCSVQPALGLPQSLSKGVPLLRDKRAGMELWLGQLEPLLRHSAREHELSSTV